MLINRFFFDIISRKAVLKKYSKLRGLTIPYHTLRYRYRTIPHNTGTVRYLTVTCCKIANPRIRESDKVMGLGYIVRNKSRA